MTVSAPQAALSCIAFSQEEFLEVVRLASRGAKGKPANTQTQYLAGHLEAIGARTIIIEPKYIDRHYMDELGTYYARCLDNVQNHCTRLHFFSTTISEATLDTIVADAVRDGVSTASAALQVAYLGFVVVRPLASVPIGRSIVTFPRGEPDASYPATTRSQVHLLGIPLEVQGLAFQQQDLAVAACATTAVWSALHRACRSDGNRPPSTSAITEAAVRNYIPYGRAFPSSGLTIEQVCEAFRTFGQPPEVFHVAGNPLAFLVTLNIYLRSGIPVILALDCHAAPSEGDLETLYHLPSGTPRPALQGGRERAGERWRGQRSRSGEVGVCGRRVCQGESSRPRLFHPPPVNQRSTCSRRVWSGSPESGFSNQDQYGPEIGTASFLAARISRGELAGEPARVGTAARVARPALISSSASSTPSRFPSAAASVWLFDSGGTAQRHDLAAPVFPETEVAIRSLEVFRPEKLNAVARRLAPAEDTNEQPDYSFERRRIAQEISSDRTIALPERVLSFVHSERRRIVGTSPRCAKSFAEVRRQVPGVDGES